jgi:hypothetical protein
MKTDDYKQELSISATLQQTNAKKNIFVFKKNQAITAELSDFYFLTCFGINENVPPSELREKSGP